MEVCLMIEGQEDVTWEDWLALAAACEEHGVGTMFRSDHYLSVDDRRERGSLDAWGTVIALGATTKKLRLGTMVSPATFRHPAVLAKTAVTADHVSGGRVEVGIGAGWWEREHELYGFDLPEIGPRMEALEEQMQIVKGHWGEGPFSFEGRYYRARELDAQPKPVRRPLPLILGGRGGSRSLRLAARKAWQAVRSEEARCSAPAGRSKASPCQWRTSLRGASPPSNGSSGSKTSIGANPISGASPGLTSAPSARASSCAPRQMPSTGIPRATASASHSRSAVRAGNRSTSSTFIGPPMKMAPATSS